MIEEVPNDVPSTVSIDSSQGDKLKQDLDASWQIWWYGRFWHGLVCAKVFEEDLESKINPVI